MTLWQHSKALLGVLFISAHLTLVLIPLVILLLLSPLPFFWPPLNALFHHCTYLLYRYAVWVNDCWFQKVVGVTWGVRRSNDRPPARGQALLDCNQSYIVIANHQSWFDIYVLQSLILRNGPMLKFLVKRSLIFVPIVGWVILALRFPLLSRRSNSAARRSDKRDFNAIERACSELSQYPTALLNFVEGTRFTEAKREQLQSPYLHLLKPKRKGLQSMLKTLEHNVSGVVDISLYYPGSSSFWQCMGGVHERIDCAISVLTCPEQLEVGDWLTERWRKKEEFMEHCC